VHDRHVVRPRDGPLDVRPLAQALDVRAARRGVACNGTQLGAQPRSVIFSTARSSLTPMRWLR
jgi:hypothetical protein